MGHHMVETPQSPVNAGVHHPFYELNRRTAWNTALYTIAHDFIGAPILPRTFSTIPHLLLDLRKF